LPVTDADRVLLDIYARADITQLCKGNAYNRLQWEDVTVSGGSGVCGLGFTLLCCAPAACPCDDRTCPKPCGSFWSSDDVLLLCGYCSQVGQALSLSSSSPAAWNGHHDPHQQQPGGHSQQQLAMLGGAGELGL
jgi:hypothetical protein